jgi:hypothetical protein
MRPHFGGMFHHTMFPRCQVLEKNVEKEGNSGIFLNFEKIQKILRIALKKFNYD